jgi:2-polyprenyl-6-methoxyphenol hydroxylase-like FAD-dependent oxidoreductase
MRATILPIAVVAPSPSVNLKTDFEFSRPNSPRNLAISAAIYITRLPPRSTSCNSKFLAQNKMSATKSKPVLITGAGIAGLALAQGLRKASIPFRVFEREVALNVRSQGYRFRLHEHGQNALKSVLEPAHYERFIESCPPNPTGMAATAVLDALTGESKESPMKVFGAGAVRPVDLIQPVNVDRGVLRDILMIGLENDVEFGKEVRGYDITPEGVVLRFDDGSEATGSLVVGADGARSKVKKQFLPDSALVDTEARLFYGKTPLTQQFSEEFEPKAMDGMTLVQDKSKDVTLSLLLEAMRFKDNEFRKNLPEDYVYWALFARKDFFKDISDADLLALSPIEAAELAKTLTSHWSNSVQALFKHQNIAETSILRIASALPNIPFWEPSPHVTLIGDAVHAMSPTAGAGAGTALRDVANLVTALVEGGINAQSVGKYEEEMRIYAGEAIQRSTLGGKMMFGMRPFEELELIRD